MTLAITGATGFVGAATLDEALGQGRTVRALTRKPQDTREGVAWVRFGIHPEQGDSDTEIICEAMMKDRRSVRDSGGHEEFRYVIDTEVLIGGQSQRVEVTLTDRDTMKFRCLLGRTAIRGKYLVDPARSYLQGKRKRRRKKGSLDNNAAPGNA